MNTSINKSDSTQHIVPEIHATSLLLTDDAGQQNLADLTLTDLETLFERELGDSDRLQAEADCLSRRSSVSLFRAGRVLSAIKKKLKGTWTKWQKDHKVGVTSAWQAIQLFSKAVSEEAVAGLTRTEALQKFDITKHKPTPVAKSGTTKKCDHKSAPVQGLKLHTGDSQEAEEQPSTDDAPADPSDDAAASEQSESTPVTTDPAMQSESTISPTKAQEFLYMINVKLEELERDLKGVTPDDHLLGLINQAISTLRLLRGDAATDIDAA